jgi:nucleoside-diphosphate-sugar epimerase
MKVFLTGGTGFIGAPVARALADRGCEVLALVRPGSPRAGRLAKTARLEVELGDRPKLAQALASFRPDVVLHLAWFAVPGEYLSSRENLALLSESIELARAAFDAGCPRFVGAGTCFEYDLAEPVRGPGLLKEDSPTRPTFLYSASKLALFHVLEQLSVLENRSFAWLRFFYQYGPEESEKRIVASVITSLLKGERAKVTEGAQVRDFLHVGDVASAVCSVALQDVRGPVNIGSGAPVTIRKLVETIAAACGRPELVDYGAVPYRPQDPMFVCADNARLRATGWKPEYDLERGIRHAVDWWRAR